LALAGAVLRSVRGAVLAGVATGIGLAIGLEALAFDAAIGACVALRFAVHPDQRPALQAYGLSLLIATLAAYGLQTPPWRWTVVACDALAFNSAAALALAGAGAFLVAALTGRAALWARLGGLVIVGALVLGVYLWLDPGCRAGPFADVDPRIKPFWLNHVNEIRPWVRLLKRDQVDAICFIVPWTMGVLAWIGLGFRRKRLKDSSWWLVGVCLIAAVATAAGAIRMTGYAEWFAVAPIAAAATEIAARYRKGGVLTAVLAGALATSTPPLR